jgi:hypothetical protein
MRTGRHGFAFSAVHEEVYRVYGLRWKRVRASILAIVPLLAIALVLFSNPIFSRAQSDQASQIKQAGVISQARVFTAQGVYTLRATEIIGTNAHLKLLPNLLHPSLTFTATTIYGFSLSHAFYSQTLVISSGGVVTSGGTTIKTSVLSDIVTGLQSFANKADLLILAAGGTVRTLIMKNVTLTVDESLSLVSIDIPDFQLVVE